MYGQCRNPGRSREYFHSLRGDEARALLHHGEDVPVDGPSGLLRAGQPHQHEIRLAQHPFQPVRPDRLVARRMGFAGTAHAEHTHAEVAGPRRAGAAHMPDSDDGERLALDAGLDLRRPAPFFLAGGEERDAAVEHEQGSGDELARLLRVDAAVVDEERLRLKPSADRQELVEGGRSDHRPAQLGPGNRRLLQKLLGRRDDGLRIGHARLIFLAGLAEADIDGLCHVGVAPAGHVILPAGDGEGGVRLAHRVARRRFFRRRRVLDMQADTAVAVRHGSVPCLGAPGAGMVGGRECPQAAAATSLRTAP